MSVFLFLGITVTASKVVLGSMTNHLSHFFAAAAALAAALSTIAFLSASFFCCGVMSERSPGFGAAGTAALCGILRKMIEAQY